MYYTIYMYCMIRGSNVNIFDLKHFIKFISHSVLWQILKWYARIILHFQNSINPLNTEFVIIIYIISKSIILINSRFYLLFDTNYEQNVSDSICIPFKILDGMNDASVLRVKWIQERYSTLRFYCFYLHRGVVILCVRYCFENFEA